MIAFEIVTFGVGAVAFVAAAVGFFKRPTPLNEFGRQGNSWFDHPDDIALSDRPSEDDRDAPIPVRRLRGRPD